MRGFIMANPDRANKFFASRPTEWWEKQGEKKALATFHEAAEKVPAYQDFLKKNGVENHEKIQTIEDFKKYVPVTTKENYIFHYDLDERLLEPYSNLFTLATTSGTTGEPVFWPRNSFQDKMTSLYFEMMAQNIWQTQKKATLIIVCFSLGNYIAGELNSWFWKDIALRNKGLLTVATPGSDLEGTLVVVKKFINHYDQIIFGGYPYFFKLFLDTGEKAGIDWKKHNIKFFYGGEGMSWDFRQNLINKFSREPKELNNIVDVYGTADAGGISYGNCLTSLIQEFIVSKKNLQTKILGKERQVVSLTQLNTSAYFVEEKDENLVITFRGAVPLIRYNILDIGGIVPFKKVLEIFQEEGVDLLNKLKERAPYFKSFTQPFLFVEGRESCISLDGANVFPTTIQDIIDKSSHFASFKLSKKADENGDWRFYVYLELKSDKNITKEEEAKLKEDYKHLILNVLLTRNHDFKRSYEDNPELCVPRIEIRRFGEDEFKLSKSGKIKFVI